jgi:hypothetical protein
VLSTEQRIHFGSPGHFTTRATEASDGLGFIGLVHQSTLEVEYLR